MPEQKAAPALPVADVLEELYQTANLPTDDERRRRAVAQVRPAFAAQDARAFALLEAAGENPTGFNADRILHRPEFTRATRIQDWRNYVPDEVRAVYHLLPPDARAAVYLMAKRNADGEEWED